jgi:predicted DNA-binding transcriptional regulator AlpA
MPGGGCGRRPGAFLGGKCRTVEDRGQVGTLGPLVVSLPIVVSMEGQQYRDEDHLSRVELAKVLHLSTKTLDRYRRTGEGPPFVTLPGGRIRYRWADVRHWLEARTREGG